MSLERLLGVGRSRAPNNGTLSAPREEVNSPSVAITSSLNLSPAYGDISFYRFICRRLLVEEKVAVEWVALPSLVTFSLCPPLHSVFVFKSYFL